MSSLALPTFSARRLLPMGRARVSVNLDFSELRTEAGREFKLPYATAIYDAQRGGFHVQTLAGVKFHPCPATFRGTLGLID